MNSFKPSKYIYRTLARFVIEAESPLAVGGGADDIYSDSPVARDTNGLPYIPGSGLMGVIRSIIDPEGSNPAFGLNDKTDNCGSRIIITDALILDSKSQIVDGLHLDSFNDKLLEKYEILPVRQHVAIDEKGVAVKGAKFDNEVVYAGSRFCFEVEILSEDEDEGMISRIRSAVSSDNSRIGGGTRKGYGSVKVVDVRTAFLNFSRLEDFELYLEKSSELQYSGNWPGWTSAENVSGNDTAADIYELNLSPRDFFLFSSGFGDEKGYADMVPVMEPVVKWDGTQGSLSDACVLIPATSVKGALRHRTLYYLNATMGNFADCRDASKASLAADSLNSLFGSVNGDRAVRGNVILSDIFVEKRDTDTKYINHVSIDSYTGGAVSGALFTENVNYAPGLKICLKAIVLRNGVDSKAMLSFEMALKDVCNGLLPLGGGVNRGNGSFTGTVTKNGELI